MIRRWLKGLLAGLFVALVGVGLAMSPLGAGLEQRVGLSWLFDRRGPVEPPVEVAVVAMDSRTGEQLGLPVLPRDWPRSIHAQLVDALVARGAGASQTSRQLSQWSATSRKAASSAGTPGRAQAPALQLATRPSSWSYQEIQRIHSRWSAERDSQ